MALTKDTETRIDYAVTDVIVGDEIAARLLVNTTPSTPAAAQSILNLLNSKQNAAIAERLYVALAGDGDGASGKELAKKINGMVAVLQAKANGNEVGQANSQFSGQVAGMTTNVTIDADVAGVAGDVTLTADSITDIDGLIAAHNIAFPANTLTLSVGDGTQVPTANIVLAGGSDGTDADLPIAKANMGSEAMSESVRFNLEHALTSKEAADNFKVSYDIMVAAIQAIV